MDTVGAHQFTALEAVIDIHGVVLALALLVWFLDTTAGGCVIVGDGESDHRIVGQFNGTLDKSLAKGAPSDDDASVLVLYGSCHDFGC